jgi:hypothetical protein
MSRISRRIRLAVVARAGACCEYCRLHSMGQVGRFPVDHILPRSQGGRTVLANLALACPHCNARKWAFTDMNDPLTGEPVALFNPRTQTWSDHFRWSRSRASYVVGRTPCGRATIARLHMNHPDLLAVRRLLAKLGIPLGVPS